MSDEEDYRKLMSAVLRQAMDDYMKMQHPKYRKLTYQKEAFWSARDLLFDDSYRMAILDDAGEPMTLQTLASIASDRGHINLKKFRSHIIERTQEYWKKKKMNTIEIPEDFVVEGHAYSVMQGASRDIDFDEKIIYINKKGPLAEEEFLQCVVELSCHHREIRTSAKARRELAKTLYGIMKVNNCFKGHC